MLHRRHFLAATAGFGLAPLIGTSVRSEPRPLPVELVSEIAGLKAGVSLGAGSPDVTLYEFFDYNCGFCRQSAREVSGLLKADPGLRYVLVNFAVLSEDSILASRIALAFARQKPSRYLAFHQALFEKKGVRAAEQAIEAALALGANEKKLVADSNSRETTNALIGAVKLGDGLGFVATPSYVAGAEANIGFLDIEQKRSVIAAMRRCERMSCG